MNKVQNLGLIYEFDTGLSEQEVENRLARAYNRIFDDIEGNINKEIKNAVRELQPTKS